MTTSADRPARWTHIELCHALALAEAHASEYRAPSLVPTAVQDVAEREAFTLWSTRNRALRADLAAELAAVRSLLCNKCEGDGKNGNQHRHRGVCYSCQGDGYSAKGRRAAGLPRRERVEFN